MSYTPILGNQNLDTQLLAEGYVVVPFLNNEEVKALTDFYYAHHSSTQEGMYATAHVPDIAFRIKMNDYIQQVFKRAIDAHFVNSNPLGGSFIAKGKGERGTLQPHQDWNIVDEEQYRSFNIWVPLVDLHEQNGAIKILPKSHRWLKSYRSANINSAFGEVNDVLWKELISLFMKKGEALIYDHRLLHASAENHTDEIRLAAVYGIIPQNAAMKYYHQKDDSTVEVYSSNPDFFLYGNIFEGPKGLQKEGELPYGFPQVSREKLYQLLGKPMPVAKVVEQSWWQSAAKSLRAIFAR